MAWNDPGNRGESPWSKKRPAPKSGGENNPFGEWLEKLKGSLGGPGAGGNSGSVGGAKERVANFPRPHDCTRLQRYGFLLGGEPSSWIAFDENQGVFAVNREKQ